MGIDLKRQRRIDAGWGSLLHTTPSLGTTSLVAGQSRKSCLQKRRRLQNLPPKKPKFRRVLLKISGEVLGGKTGGICVESVHDIAGQVREVARLGVQIGVVVGGGNIFRGLQGSEKGIERATGDYMGMLATVINSMALQDALEKQGWRPVCNRLSACRRSPSRSSAAEPCVIWKRAAW
ncbi:MAG: hypothetical protein Ct9H300mP7_2090 [Verrucomicrobiota bacterium]|nr:MAG: hypothetical protein Ct9H300mP7_2090 [Verrucomicrobiota bacterium]